MTANKILTGTLSKAGFETWQCDTCGQRYSDFPGGGSARVCGYCDADNRAATAALNISALDTSSDFVAPEENDGSTLTLEEARQMETEAIRALEMANIDLLVAQRKAEDARVHLVSVRDLLILELGKVVASQ